MCYYHQNTARNSISQTPGMRLLTVSTPYICQFVQDNVFSTGVLCTVSAHDKHELGTSNLRRNLPPVVNTYVCACNVHEIAVSRKVRGVYE